MDLLEHKVRVVLRQTQQESARADSLAAELEGLRRYLAELEASRSAHAEALTAAQEEAARIERHNQLLLHELAQLRAAAETLQTAGEEGEAAAAEVEQLKQTIEQLRAENAALQSRMERAESINEAVETALREEVAQLHRALAQERERVMAGDAEFERLVGELDQARRQLAAAETLRAEAEELRAALAEAQQAAQPQSEPAAEADPAQQARVAALEQELAQMSEELKRLRTSRDQARAKLVAALKMVEQLEHNSRAPLQATLFDS